MEWVLTHQSTYELTYVTYNLAFNNLIRSWGHDGIAITSWHSATSPHTRHVEGVLTHQSTYEWTYVTYNLAFNNFIRSWGHDGIVITSWHSDPPVHIRGMWRGCLPTSPHTSWHMLPININYQESRIFIKNPIWCMACGWDAYTPVHIRVDKGYLIIYLSRTPLMKLPTSPHTSGHTCPPSDQHVTSHLLT